MEEDFEQEECTLPDLAAIFNLGQRDWTRASKQVRLEDLSPRQLAVSVSLYGKFIVAADMMDLGGHCVSCPHVQKMKMSTFVQYAGVD